MFAIALKESEVFFLPAAGRFDAPFKNCCPGYSSHIPLPLRRTLVL